MRILVVSNLFPPHFIGGYELGCAEVVAHLRARGHQVQVLCSSFKSFGAREEPGVWRWLEHDFSHFAARHLRRLALRVARRPARDAANARHLERAVRQHRPDGIFVWNLGGTTPGLIELAPGLRPTAAYISDSWLAHWCQQRPHAPYLPPKPREALDEVQLIFCSSFLREQTEKAGAPVETAQVAHWGVDAETFFPANRAVPSQDRLALRWLFCGQVVPHKGAHTAIEAALRLFIEGAPRGFQLSVVGGSRVRGYVRNWKKTVALHDAEGAIRFLGQRPRSELPALLREHDGLVLPSVWEEPFSISLVEAMASGLAIVSTSTGGTREILRHEFNGLRFPPGDASSCAHQMRRLIEDPALSLRLRQNARATVEQSFRIEAMVDRIEPLLRQKFGV
jgi:glycogen(starch) synthase